MSNSFITTLDILAAIKRVIEALKLFDAVEYFSDADLVGALKQLHLNRQRVCLIIPDNDRYESTNAGRETRVQVFREIVLLFAERSAGRPQAASTGDDAHTGVVALKDVLEDKLTGLNLGFKPRLIRLHPVAGQSVLVALEKSAGRKAWQMTWEVSGGHKVVQEF